MGSLVGPLEGRADIHRVEIILLRVEHTITQIVVRVEEDMAVVGHIHLKDVVVNRHMVVQVTFPVVVPEEELVAMAELVVQIILKEVLRMGILVGVVDLT